LPINPGISTLDLGCGTGILFDLLRRRVGPSGLVTGVDFALSMVERRIAIFPSPT